MSLEHERGARQNVEKHVVNLSKFTSGPPAKKGRGKTAVPPSIGRKTINPAQPNNVEKRRLFQTIDDNRRKNARKMSIEA